MRKGSQHFQNFLESDEDLSGSVHSKAAYQSIKSLSEAELNMTGKTGSLLYMAPEVWFSQPYNKAVDVYSVRTRAQTANFSLSLSLSLSLPLWLTPNSLLGSTFFVSLP